MTRYVLKSGFDIVEAAEGGFEQLFLVLIRKSLTITKLHGNFRHIYSSTTSLGRIMEKLEAFAARRSDGIYTSSLAYARSISNEYKIPLERIKIIPYGIDLSGLDNFETQDLRQRYPTIANKKVIFLTVGSSPERKGARIFVEAAKRVEESQLMFVLSCSDPRFFEAPELPQNLLILPNLERAEFYNWLAQSDVIVFPSQFESFSIAVREAMLFGKAIVVSPQIPFEGVDTEYPRHYILPAIEPALLANAVLEITNGGSNFPAVGPEFHSRLKNNYDIRRVAQATLDFYKEVAGTAKAG
jgi:glycosyltransferase involved in cell wall biosynthesis